MPVRILLADDHAILRQGLKRILESYPDFQVVGEAATGVQAVELTRELQPDVAIIDVAMPELNGLEATAQIRKRVPKTAVLILSMYNDARYVTRALNAGARGYLLKDSVEEDLVGAIQLACQGQSFFSPAVAALLARQEELSAARPVEDRYELLTERERQIYQLLAEGQSNKEIAGLLNLSLHTVETHRTRIMEKLDVHSSAELVLSAVRRGLVH
ncbi:MAG: response regulator transcription factor [Acidobacteria bacterium]|nr:response regulator transcription factor [Acidobacteriota bacterium]